MGLEFWTVTAVGLLGFGGLLLLTVRERARTAERERRRIERSLRANDEAAQLRRLLLSWTWEVADGLHPAPALAGRAQKILEYIETLDGTTEARVERVDLATRLPPALAAEGVEVEVEAEGTAWALVAPAKFERALASLLQVLQERQGGSLTLRIRAEESTVQLEIEPVRIASEDTEDLRWIMATQWLRALGATAEQRGQRLVLALPRNDPNPAGPSGAVRAVRMAVNKAFVILLTGFVFSSCGGSKQENDRKYTQPTPTCNVDLPSGSTITWDMTNETNWHSHSENLIVKLEWTKSLGYNFSCYTLLDEYKHPDWIYPALEPYGFMGTSNGSNQINTYYFSFLKYRNLPDQRWERLDFKIGTYNYKLYVYETATGVVNREIAVSVIIK